VISIYFGGGTPSLLSGDNIARVMDTLKAHFTLSDPEITFEAEPVSLTKAKAQLLKRHGVNRISVGIQSFSDEIVLRTGRKDTERQALAAIDLALETGAVVNIDLISGLPGETDETWRYSVRRAVETGAPSVTVYKLQIYSNTEYFADLRRDRISVPTDADEFGFAEVALDALTEAGYQPVNFFTMTRNGGFVPRHTTTKWQGVDVYAFGASAFGALGNWAFQNAIDLPRYSEVVERGELPVFRGYVYSALELMTRDAILGMKLVRFDRAGFAKRHGFDLVRLCGATLETLEHDGFVTVGSDEVALTRKGILWGDYVGRTVAQALECLRG
jgi:oxygen-independent coproporphyrinogen-3 oxidase